MKNTTGIMNDIAQSTKPATRGAYLTARQMALRPGCSLDRTGDHATDLDGARWAWSDMTRLWICTMDAPTVARCGLALVAERQRARVAV